MPNITLSIPMDLHRLMRKYPEIRWSEVVRQSIMKKLRDLEMMDRLLEKSKLSVEDVDEIDHLIKGALEKKILKRVKKLEKT